MDNYLLVMRAEHLAEMAGEAESKKEANAYWREYKAIMAQVTGDKNLFRKKPSNTNRPSRDLVKTVRQCKCGTSGFRWARKNREYEFKCGHNPSVKIGRINKGLAVYTCGVCREDSGEQVIGLVVMFSCDNCGIKTGWHPSNALARDEWNAIQTPPPDRG
jgi:predicted SprT family Zn-dependent metalloprotease